MDIVVIDGCGGGIGKGLVTALIKRGITNIIAVGLNQSAAAAMKNVGAKQSFYGEAAVLRRCTNADIIMGPIGIAMSGALQNEVSPAVAEAISQSDAYRILVPVNKCRTLVAGTKETPLKSIIEEAAELAEAILSGKVR